MIAVASWIACAGCARFEARPVVPGQTARALDARSLDDPGLRRFLDANHRTPSGPGWAFEDLYLAALYYHPALDLARAQWQTALGGDKVAAGRPNPTASLVPGYNISSVSPLTPWMPAVTFDVPIETAGKRGYRMAQARHLSESARLNVATAAWQVRNGLRVALTDHLAAEKREAILGRQGAFLESIVASLDQRFQAGAVSGAELAPTRIALNRARIELLDARQQRADSRVRLAEAMGLPAAALTGIGLQDGFDPNTGALATMLTPDARREALQSRSDILAALAEYEASQSALQLEIARQYPDIHIGPGYQYDQGDHKFTLALNAELPVFNQNQGPIATAKAKRNEAAARFIGVQAKAIAEIDRATASFRIARENLAAMDSLSETQKRQLATVEQQVQAGAAERLDLLNARIDAAGGDLLRLAAETKLRQSAAALEDAVQRPLSAPGPSAEQSPRAPRANPNEP